MNHSWLTNQPFDKTNNVLVSERQLKRKYITKDKIFTLLKRHPFLSQFPIGFVPSLCQFLDRLRFYHHLVK